ncbi:uncharacterized protein LOC126427365 isoform X1 [Schistocerca serialis cubense]|uniref:uncharacterized protein LOC126427365 isoform X1 n=2 Tax=Schistocerca serialis cubense TaxID=2023355 RepID=UPI00214EA546|nr:uncharacterized protein LOC126427365 isoform X1 [Schistocerca serialis cubense]
MLCCTGKTAAKLPARCSAEPEVRGIVPSRVQTVSRTFAAAELRRSSLPGRGSVRSESVRSGRAAGGRALSVTAGKPQGRASVVGVVAHAQSGVKRGVGAGTPSEGSARPQISAGGRDCKVLSAPDPLGSRVATAPRLFDGCSTASSLPSWSPRGSPTPDFIPASWFAGADSLRKRVLTKRAAAALSRPRTVSVERWASATLPQHRAGERPKRTRSEPAACARQGHTAAGSALRPCAISGLCAKCGSPVLASSRVVQRGGHAGRFGDCSGEPASAGRQRRPLWREVRRLRKALEALDIGADGTRTVEHHLSGNRWRNAVVREDFPRARDEQRREQELAEEMRRRQALEQEEYDARVAAELAERMEREEAAKRAALETQDQHVAWRLQEREKQRLGPPHSPTPPLQLLQPVLDPDPNCVGLPPPPDELSARMRVLRIQGAGRAENPMPRSPKGLPRSTENLADVDAIEDYVEDEELGDTDALDEEEARRIQEEKDAELARMLQEREAAEADPRRHLSDLDRDRLMAIEAQDRELARLLQERERAKARRAKERARQRAALKRQQQLAAEADAILPAPPTPLSPSPPPVPAVRPTDLDVSPVYRHPGTRSDSGLQAGYQYPAEEEEEPHGYRGSPNSMSPTNIAAAIDPTYRRGSAHSPSLIECVDLESPPSPALPYMPIQGQRRCPPQPDKRTSRKEQQAGKRDACRQQ